MKLKSSLATLSKLLVIMTTALSLTSATLVQAASSPSQITIHNQDINTGVVVVDSVTAPRSGWVVIYRKPDFAADEMVGYAPVHQGSNMGVKVVVSMPLIGNRPMLWAVLQADNGVPGVFEWGHTGRAFDDDPLTQNGQLVTMAFATTSTPAAIEPVTASDTTKTPLTDQITISNQDITSGLIMVDSVTASQDGWVVIYRNPNFTAGEIVGYAPVYHGTNTNVKVTIDTTKVGDQTTLYAQLHTDGGFQGVFEWGNQRQLFNDWPVVQKDKYVTTSFATVPTPSTVSTTAPGTDRITLHDQDINTGVIVVDSVTTTQNGWVVIYRDPDFTSGQIVGYAPVYKGTNMGVKVTLDTTKLENQPTLWAVLHVDSGLQGIFEWGYKGRPFGDPPVFQKGQYVSAAFGTSAR
jgi:hypothetical protein